MEQTKLGEEALRAQVAVCVDAGRRARMKIRTSRDRARYDAWNEKRFEGQAARCAFLALAFYRGMPYAHVEPVIRDPFDLGEVAARIAHIQYTAEQARDPAVLAHVRAEVRAWAAVPETPERKAWRLERMKAGMAKRDAARVRRNPNKVKGEEHGHGTVG